MTLGDGLIQIIAPGNKNRPNTYYISKSNAKMLILRWILFLPALLLVTAVVQLIGGVVGEQGPWWIWFFVYASFGWYASAAVVFKTSLICPKPKIGSLMFLGVFIVAELIGYSKGFSTRPALENIIRGGIDLGVIGALVVSSNMPSENI